MVDWTFRERIETVADARQSLLDWAELNDIDARHKIGLLVLSFSFILPVFVGTVRLSLLIPALYLVVFAISWDMVSGYSGAFSFGHTLFYGIGGYTSTVLNLQYGMDPVVGIVVGTLLAGLGGILIGVPTLRLEGPYFALISLIAPLVLFQGFIYFGETFGGHDGIVRSPMTLVGTTSESYITVDGFATMILVDYYIALVFAVVMFAIAWLITRSDAGTILLAIRTNEDAVKALGINTAKFKVTIFIISGLMGGLAGAMFVHSTAGQAIPEMILSVSVMIDVILMVLIGGIGTISGAVLGVILFELIDIVVETISTEPYRLVIPGIDKTLDDLMPVPLFVVAMLVVYYMPGGVIRKLIETGDEIRELLDERGVLDRWRDGRNLVYDAISRGGSDE